MQEASSFLHFFVFCTIAAHAIIFVDSKKETCISSTENLKARYFLVELSGRNFILPNRPEQH